MELYSDQTDPVMDLTSQSYVDASSRNRTIVQEELERRLRCRAEREDLVKKNILPDLSTSPKLFTQTQQLQRAQIADNLQKKLRNRADRNDLMQMNILPDLYTGIDPGLQAKQLQLRKSKLADTLNEKLATRPGPLELIQGGILEPKSELAAVVENVPFEKTTVSTTKPWKQGIPGIALQRTSSDASRNSALQKRHSVDTVVASPGKDATSPLSESGYVATRKFSDSSPSPAPSPSDSNEVRSPVKSPQFITSPKFTQSYPPPAHLPKAMHTPGIMSSIGKAPSPSQTRKKQQKQQKYRKLRYHEYVPPSKHNGKGGKTTSKSSSKSETPYNLLLQQQQLFLQLQVLQQQYPNGVLMKKLPDLMNSLSSKEKAAGKGRSSVTSPSGDAAKSNVGPIIPQMLQVEQPNRLNATSVRFDELKVSDLKVACKELGMIVSGKKAELVERLLEHNKGVLPAVALPDNSHSRDVRRHTYSMSHTSSVDSQVSAPSTVSPASPSLSPIFKFPSDQRLTSCSKMAGGSYPPSSNPMRQDSLTTCTVTSMSPQVFPASNLQQQFDEMVERQKRSYISQKAPKSLAPRPELNDMVAIKFSCPMEQQQPHKSSKGNTLPHRSDSKQQLSLIEKQSRSLPSSPQPQSPENVHSVMDDTPAQEMQPLSLQNGFHGNMSDFPPPPPSTNPSSDSLFIAPRTAPLSMTTSTIMPGGSNSMMMGPSILPSYYHPHHPMRPSRSSVPVPTQPQVHPINPPSYSSSLQRSMSLSAAAGMGHSLPRMHSGTSFSSDVSDVAPSSEMSKPMTPDNILLASDEFMEVPMDTEYKDQHLSEIFDILRAEGSEYCIPSQPHSLGHYTKYGTRHESLQSDSLMLGSSLAFGNPSLAPQQKSGSDLCLLPIREGQKNPGASNVYGNSNLMISNELGWLDLDSSSNVLSLSPTTNTFTGLNPGYSNPGSLPQEQFMNFLDDGQMKSSNPNLNGLNSHGGDMHSFLDPGLCHHSGLLMSADETSALIELGLTTTV